MFKHRIFYLALEYHSYIVHSNTQRLREHLRNTNLPMMQMFAKNYSVRSIVAHIGQSKIRICSQILYGYSFFKVTTQQDCWLMAITGF